MQGHSHDSGRGLGDTVASQPKHAHDHAHPGHASHDHGHVHAHPTLRPSVLGWAMVATLALVVAEVVGGFLGHSVALLNDAVHNLSDVPALGISWLAMRWAERPADSEKTYGYHRAGTLAAFTNAIVLVILSLWLGYEAIERLRAPVAVVESWMIWTSLAALAVNGGITLALVRGRKDLNLRSILIHNFGDALSNIAIIGGAIAIRLTGAHWIDPLRPGDRLARVVVQHWHLARIVAHPPRRAPPRDARRGSRACHAYDRQCSRSSRPAHLVAGWRT